MSARDRIFFTKGINQYVPAMQYSSNMVGDQPVAFSLGTPAAVSATAVTTVVPANATAGTVVALTTPWTADSPYGRTLRLTPSGDPGNSAAILVRGVDYLGQPMAELFTGASGSTAILYGKKAFYRVDDTKVSVASSNAVTWNVGTGFRLGLPYKGDVAWARENGIPVAVFTRPFWRDVVMSDADATAGGSFMVVSPCPGYVSTLAGQPSATGSTTNAAATVKLATVAITGLTVTPDQDTLTRTTDTPTTLGYNANNRLRTNDAIEIVQAATTSAGPTTLSVEITPTQFTLPDTTDPATTATGDGRGTYEALMTYDGSNITVGMIGDNSVNAAGNGGLHGIRQVTG